FARGTDNAVYHKWQVAPNNGWSGWESLGGVITSNIATGVNADGRMEFFARGTDGAVYHKWQV
ncbi:peptidase M23, partial [Streptomyces europaeiscabiei]|nr:peptidase M23 [Streptomyces europaeiscabiei]